jgi:alpha-L-fucosidase 2
MKNYKSLLSFLLSIFSFYFSFAQPANQNEWSDYMQHTRIYWDSLGTDYFDGIIAGNGSLGVNMYRQSERSIRFDIGRSDVTDQRPHYPDSMFAEQLISHPRLPIGKMLLHTTGSVLSASIFLNIYNAEARGTINTTAGSFAIYFLVPSGEEVIHIETSELSGSEKLTFEWVGEKAISPRISSNSNRNEYLDYKENPPFRMMDTLGFSVCYQPLLFNGEYATVFKKKNGDGKQTIDLSIGYSETKKNVAILEAIGSLNKFSSQNISTVIAFHKKWWNDFFQQSFISIPDKNIESYYWLQLYKLGSATRENKSMIDLMGPWFYSGTGWPGIWWNLNTQLTYSSMFTSNHSELSKPLFNLLNKNQQQLINNVPEQWRNDAASISRITSFDLYSPMAQFALNRGKETFEPGNLVWALLYYYKLYQYSGDEAEMKNKIFPLLKRSVNYLMHLLYKDEKGMLHLVRSLSPEYGAADDAHYSLSGLMWGLKTLIQTNKTLKLNNPDLSKWKDVLEHLAPLPADKNGYMIGKDVPFVLSHRHYAHLFAIYPYRLLNMDDPIQKNLASKSLEHWLSLPKKHRGYSLTGASSMHSFLGDGENALKYLEDFLVKNDKPSGLYGEGGGPCFETPMSFATSLLEMLIQSDDGRIKILPAIPKSWKDISFSKLGAEGAFLVDATLQQGKLHEVKIKSLKGHSCLLEVEGGNDYILTSSLSGVVNPIMKTINNKTSISFQTKAGESFQLKRKDVNIAKNLVVNFKEDVYFRGLRKAH